jgi:excisionase family DNA binding protein
MDKTTDRPLKFLTYQQVADLLLVGRRTVAAWVASGRLPVVWVGPRCPRVLESDLGAFINERRGTRGKAGR